MVDRIKNIGQICKCGRSKAECLCIKRLKVDGYKTKEQKELISFIRRTMKRDLAKSWSAVYIEWMKARSIDATILDFLQWIANEYYPPVKRKDG